MKNTTMKKIIVLGLVLITIMLTLTSCYFMTPSRGVMSMGKNELYAFIQTTKASRDANLRLEDYPYGDLKFEKGETQTIIPFGYYELDIPAELILNATDIENAFVYSSPEGATEQSKIVFQVNQNILMAQIHTEVDEEVDALYAKYTGTTYSKTTIWDYYTVLGSYTPNDADKKDHEQLKFLASLLMDKTTQWGGLYSRI